MPREFHVLPLNDLREHDEHRGCWCEPDATQEPDADVVVVHHALDGRELVEVHGVN